MTEQANKYPGYTLVRQEASPLFHGVATTLTHDVSGATVLLIENEDENKAFGIGFGTFPCDDTGVFHILEHSVLAGSEKYPVTSPFMQLVKSSMASFLNAMTFPDKTVYPFATPNEADFRNLMDVYLNAVFCPLAVTERSVFEQEGWHREADGHFSGVVYNEMQGALAAPEARLDAAMDAALFPDNGYGFVSGGDPASIPGLSYEQYVKIYRRHYRPDNCCITLYGKMDMAEKLAFLDEHYLSRMPKGAPRPRTPLQYPQAGVKKTVVYETETPESIPVQCALGWYTGRFEEMEKQTAVNVLLDALLATNQSPLKKYLLEQNLGADIDAGFDGSVQQPVIELVLKGTDSARAARFAQAVREGVEAICAAGIPDELLTASINSYEFQVTERPGSLPDGVLAAIEAATGWLHTGDPMADLRPEPVFDFLRGKLGTSWYTDLLAELFAPAPPGRYAQRPAGGQAAARPPADRRRPGAAAPLPGRGGGIAGRPDPGGPALGGQPLPQLLLRPRRADCRGDGLRGHSARRAGRAGQRPPHCHRAEHPAQYLAGRKHRHHQHLDRPAAGRALHRQADRPRQPAGTESRPGRRADGRAAV